HVQGTLEASLGIDERARGLEGPHLPAVSTAKADVGLLADPRPPALEQLVHPLLVLLEEEVPFVAAEQVLDLVAKHLRHARVDEVDAGLGIQYPDTLVGGFDNPAELLLALAATFFRPLLAGNVHGNAVPDSPAIREPPGGRAAVQPADLAVRRALAE